MDLNAPVDHAPDLLADLVNQWIQDTFHGSRLGRELSDRSQGEILAAKDVLIGKLRALPK
jgi:hypothetical protein